MPTITLMTAVSVDPTGLFLKCASVCKHLRLLSYHLLGINFTPKPKPKRLRSLAYTHSLTHSHTLNARTHNKSNGFLSASSSAILGKTYARRGRDCRESHLLSLWKTCGRELENMPILWKKSCAPLSLSTLQKPASENMEYMPVLWRKSHATTANC